MQDFEMLCTTRHRRTLRDVGFFKDKSIPNRHAGRCFSGLSNHLGNVLVTFSDKRLGYCEDDTVYRYGADVRTANDYAAFGAPLDDRQWYSNSDSSSYRYGFNGQEKDNDNDVSGVGNALSFEYRVHDVRLGRFLSRYPLGGEYPWNSPYAFAENDVISCKDLEGLERAESPPPPSLTTSAFIVYNYIQVGQRYFVTYQVFNGTDAQAVAARRQNAENGGNGQEITAEQFRAGLASTVLNRNYLNNPGFSPAPDIQTSSTTTTNGLTPAGNGTVNNFAYNTTPAASVPPFPTAMVVNVTAQTTLTIDYSLFGAADRIVVTDATGAILYNGTTTGSGTVTIPLNNATGNLTITITTLAGSTMGSYTATVATRVITTYLDPAAGNTEAPTAVPTIPTNP